MAISSHVVGFLGAVSVLGGLTLSSPPSDDLRGAVLGNSFRPNVVRVKSLNESNAKTSGKTTDRASVYHLHFQEGDEFIAAESLTIFLQVNPRKSVAGLSLDQMPYKFGTDEYRAQHFPHRTVSAQLGRGVTAVFVSTERPKVKHDGMWSDEIDCRIRFGPAKNGFVEGTIDLRMPKKSQTWLQGKFRAKLE